MYRAKDRSLGRQVAIKVLPAHLASNTRRVNGWRLKLSPPGWTHPYILVLDLIAGNTLCQRLRVGAAQRVMA
jgi:hypothetical protein